jgi:hypothetical protein
MRSVYWVKGHARLNVCYDTYWDSQGFCLVVLELAESACYCSFNAMFDQPLHGDDEHGYDDVSNAGIPISVYTTIELDRISPD